MRVHLAVLSREGYSGCQLLWVQEADSSADVAALAGLQPHNMPDMRAFLSLSSFLTEVLPLLGPDLFSR